MLVYILNYKQAKSMTYNILNKTESITVNTEVEYDFDGQKVVVIVSHFNPISEANIIHNQVNN